jgi:phenylacetic acid degradation protein
MSSYSIDGIVPVVDPSSYVHPLASLIGDVIIGPGCYIGPFASLRGDFGRIVLDSGCNIQDSCTVHTGLGTDTLIGRDGHVGHGAILHGCRLMPNVLIGMNATVMDDAVIGEDSIVGAMAYVKARFQVPTGVLVTGIPAKIVRTLSEADLALKAEGTRLYHKLAQRSLGSLREADPLRQVDSNRLQQRNKHQPEI